MTTHSRFYSSLGLLILLNLIIKPVWIFLVDRQVQNIVGPEIYGTYFSLFNFSIVFSFLLDWGLTNYFNRELSTRQEMNERISDFFFTRILFSLLYVTVVFAVACFSGVKDWGILSMVVIVQVLTSFFIFFRSIITAHQWFRTDAWLSVLDKMLMTIICGSLIWFSTTVINIHTFLSIQTGCLLIGVICAAVIVKNKNIQLFQFRTKPIGKKTFYAALPFGLVVLLMSAHYRLDGFLLERLHPDGATEAGIYAGAYRLLDAANMIGFLVASFLLPFVARHSADNKMINEAVVNARHVLIVFSGFIAVITLYMAPWINAVLYHNNLEENIKVIRWCLPALIGYSLVQVYGTVLTATGQVVSLCYLVLISLFINLLLNLFLIPSLGARACCLSALISQLFCGISTMLFAQRQCKLRLQGRSVVLYVIIMGAVAGLLFLCVNSVINNWLLIGACALLTIVMSIITGLFDPRHWTTILKQTDK